MLALGGRPADPKSAIIGAAAGYLLLWSVYWAFKLATGKEGMGYGDFKLLAALGAWLGAQMILPIVLGASVLGALVGLAMKASGALRDPASANKGQANEGLVKENVKASLEAFEDEDRDGIDD